MSIDVIRSKIVIAGLSYIQPVFRAEYVQIRVTAEVTMPDVLNVDIVTPTDLVTLSTNKVLADTSNGLTEQLALGVDKSFVDTQYLGDTALIGDIQPHRDGIELVLPIDTITGISFQKYLEDTFQTLDAAIATKLYVRDFADDFTLPDQPYKNINPKAKTDAAITSDHSQKGVDKALAEGLSIIDNMDGNIQHHLFKTFSDIVSEADAQIIDFNSQKSDNIATSSSGILSMQDYCDITYFLEDYVGLSRTFT